MIALQAVENEKKGRKSNEAHRIVRGRYRWKGKCVTHQSVFNAQFIPITEPDLTFFSPENPLKTSRAEPVEC